MKRKITKNHQTGAYNTLLEINLADKIITNDELILDKKTIHQIKKALGLWATLFFTNSSQLKEAYPYQENNFLLLFQWFYFDSTDINMFLQRLLLKILNTEEKKKMFRDYFLDFQQFLAIKTFLEMGRPVSSHSFPLIKVFFNSEKLRNLINLFLEVYQKPFLKNLSLDVKNAFISKLIEEIRTKGTYEMVNTLLKPGNLKVLFNIRFSEKSIDFNFIQEL